MCCMHNHTIRYRTEINRLADKYWPQNLIIVCHLFGVCTAAAMTSEEVHTRFADYCGFVEMWRASKQSIWRRQTSDKITETVPAL